MMQIRGTMTEKDCTNAMLANMRRQWVLLSAAMASICLLVYLLLGVAYHWLVLAVLVWTVAYVILMFFLVRGWFAKRHYCSYKALQEPVRIDVCDDGLFSRAIDQS